MEKHEIHHGCKGCVDWWEYGGCCDFLANHKRVRPVPAGPEGCVLKAPDWDTQAELEKQHAWDQKRALQLMGKGENIFSVAGKVGASINAVGAMLFGNPPPEKPVPPSAAPEVTWSSDEIPVRSNILRDGPYRAAANQKKGRNSVEKGTWKWKREEEFLPLYNAYMSDAEIGEKMGLSAKTISIYRQKMGYPYIAGKHTGKKMKNVRKGVDTSSTASSSPSPRGEGSEGEESPSEKRREEKPSPEGRMPR